MVVRVEARPGRRLPRTSTASIQDRFVFSGMPTGATSGPPQ